MISIDRHAPSSPGLALALGLLCACSTAACGAGAGGAGPVERDVAVVVAPPAVTLLAGGTAAFAAAVTGTIDAGVNWSVEPSGCGAISDAGLFTAPASVGTCVVRATSRATPSASGTATAAVVPDLAGGAPGGGGTAYHVGVAQTYRSLGAIPWSSLRAGDTVYVHHPAPTQAQGGIAANGDGVYHEKFLVSTAGTASQWIRVLGVPGPGGELPVISGQGAVTAPGSDWRTGDLPYLEHLAGPVALSRNNSGVFPSFVEIAGLEIRGARPAYSFTSENGTTKAYDYFAACIYLRAPKHVLVRDNVIHDCQQGLYNWTGDGAANGTGPAATDITIRRNYFHDNGNPGGWTEHQVYTEADRVLVEGNRFGTMRSGAFGNQLKDRSAGAVIRYNWFESSPEAYHIDLVEPEESWPVTGSRQYYGQDFVYGNVFLRRSHASENFIHWNEDHQEAGTKGRSEGAARRLHYFHNSHLMVKDAAWSGAVDYAFNGHFGAYDCPPNDPQGRVDLRNNVYATISATGGNAMPYGFGRCGTEKFDFGTNWMTAGRYVLNGNSVTGTGNLVFGTSPGYASTVAGAEDLRLATGSPALGLGGALAPAVTDNALGLDLTPTQQYALPHGIPTPTLRARTRSGAGSDLGALER